MPSKGKELKVWMIFEVLATDKDTAENSLNEHVERLGGLNGVEILETDFDDTQEVEKPHPEVDKGYSKVCEIEAEIETLELLVEVILNFGPTMIEVLEPDRIELEMDELQDALNSVASMMQKYLQSGVGGVIISGGEANQGSG